MAERTGVPVVSNFRARDIAAGGQGAPLVPYVDYLLFRHRTRTRIALNIGGIANITVIPRRRAARRRGGVRHRTRQHGDRRAGARIRAAATTAAAESPHRGRVNTALLDELLRDPYYRRKPPKSAGREQYGAEFVARLKTIRAADCAI